MPSTLSGSFASAAAGSTNDTSARTSTRPDGSNSGDWQRRTNGGATQTFRRSSTTTTLPNPNQPRDSSVSSINANGPSAGTYVPPHVTASRASAMFETRYSRSQLLDLYRQEKDCGDLSRGLESLFVGDWTDSLTNGDSIPKWNRRDEHKSNHAVGPDVCWSRNGAMEPLGLLDLTEEEKELFMTSVNSPLKGPQQAGVRDANHREVIVARKGSISHSNNVVGNAFGLSSPGLTRPQNRRRETSESYPFPPASPFVTTTVAREDGQESAFSRRRIDVQEDELERTRGEANKDVTASGNENTFGPVRRTVANPVSAGHNDPPSPWSSATANQGMNQMGTFGNLGLVGPGQSPLASIRRPDLGPSRESRFRSLMTKASVDADSQTESEELGLRSRGRLDEGIDVDHSAARPMSGDTDPFSREHYLHELDDLGTRSDERYGELGTSRRRQADDQAGFSSFGHRAFVNQEGALDASNRASRSDQYPEQYTEPLSPTFTNPYASPQQRLSNIRDDDSEDSTMTSTHLPGLGNVHQDSRRETYNNRRDMDRTAPYHQEIGQVIGSGSSNRGFPSLVGLGGLPGLGNADPWSARSRSGTPNRERALGDFNESNMRSPAAFQSPALVGPSVGGFGGMVAGGRGGRLGSLLPMAMQEQARRQHDESLHFSSTEGYDERIRNEGTSREMESPFQGSRGKFEDFFGEIDQVQRIREGSQALVDDQIFNAAPGQPLSHQASFQQTSSSHDASTSNQPPTAQQKTMVMPDRIRWIYRDPQGVVQGPWSGLEMHDWYRAGFFSPELLVKKLEDVEYEPLAQLIRRIGNSREPFLVPQIGIPHPTSTHPGVSQWPSQNTVNSPSTAISSAQPPFAGSFPSFGTTLTADQQNALERRKQEEQYLMARQKEHLAHQQVLVRQMQGQQGLHLQGLQHHSSAQSLNSQPSYGSLSSPNGFQASPPQSMIPLNQSLSTGFDGFRGAGRVGLGSIGSGLDNLSQIREEDGGHITERIDTGHHRQEPVGRPQFQDTGLEERSAQMLADRSRLQQEQDMADSLQKSYGDHESHSKQRMQEFHRLQTERHASEHQQAQDYSDQRRRSSLQVDDSVADLSVDNRHAETQEELQNSIRNLSLTEQVQKAAIAKHSPTVSAWPQPEFVPPQSSSPLPAPAARRGGPSLAESLAAESLPQSQSPSMEIPSATSSLAPWAREQQEVTHKQPSLKEIQEAEARRTAKAEQIAAIARRAALEREAASQPPPPAPGLPSSSTWASGDSPLVSSAPTSLAWTKTVAPKTIPPSNVKKSLQQIQQEEEAATRKKRSQASSTAATASILSGTTLALTGGKRYADLAGKVATAATPSPPAGSAWMTVGASGKAKVAAASTGPLPLSRAVSNSVLSTTVPQTKKSIATVTKTSLAVAQQTAMEDFKKWAMAELRSDLNKSFRLDDVVNTLLDLPAETEIIMDSVHQASHTLDSRHFAEEFVRRRALAEKGKTDVSASTSAQLVTADPKAGNGWSEVARKGGGMSMQSKDDAAGVAGFKIVAGKKKGKK